MPERPCYSHAGGCGVHQPGCANPETPNRALELPHLDAAELTRHLAYLLGQYERVIAMVRHIRMDTPEDQELSERVVAAMEEGAAPVRRVLDGERSDLVPRPDAATLREQIVEALHVSTDSCARCKVCDRQVDYVMAVLAEHGLVERGEP